MNCMKLLIGYSKDRRKLKNDTASTVKTYKSLSGVEQAFRSYKTMDLKVRPIYHHLENRVRAHVFYVC